MVSSRTIARLRNVALVAVGMAGAALIFVFTFATLIGQPVGVRNFIEALLGGALIGALLAAYELLFVDGRYGRWIRGGHFAAAMSLSIVVYLVTITGVVLIYEAIAYSEAGPDSYLGYPIDHNTAMVLDVVGAFLVISLLLFLVAIRRLVGGRQLGNLLLGRYRTGIYEERIFLFLDIEASTQLAENLGDLGAYNMISTFFFDIDEAILDHNGEAHRYIGDEVVITWPLPQGFKDASCLRCFFAVEDIIERRAGVYEARFGRVPKFRGGMHCGRVVAGFCGDSKRQISFFGDTVNTAARVEKTCRKLGFQLVASEDVIKNLTVPPELEVVELGGHELRGKSRSVELFGVRRRQQSGGHDEEYLQAAS